MPSLTSNTPVRLEEEVRSAFAEAYAEMIATHGPSYAVNVVLAHHLRKRGHSIAPIATPSEKIAAAQTRRWEETREANETEDDKITRKRERRRERVKARNKKLKEAAEASDKQAQAKLDRARELKRKRDERHRAKKKREKEALEKINRLIKPDYDDGR